MSAEARLQPRSTRQGQSWPAALVAFLLVLLVVAITTFISAPTRTRTVPLFPPGPHVAEAFRSAEAFVIAGLILGVIIGLIASRLVMKVWDNEERWDEFIAGYLFLIPYLLITLVFTVGVLLFALYIAFFKYDIFTAPIFTGFSNFIRAFQTKDFLQSLVNVFWYALIVTPIQTFLALLLAVLLNGRLRGKEFFRTVMYTPSVTSSVVISMIFWWLYLKTGYVNFVLAKLVGAFGGQYQRVE